MAFKKIGALWLKEGKNGKYMSGTIQEDVPAGAKLLVFKNTYKKDEKHPDYTINVADDERQPRDDQHSQAGPPPQEDVPF